MSTKSFSNPNTAAQNQLVVWLNEAGMAEGNKKANLLRKIIEVLVHSAPQMIPTHLEIILSYSSDKCTDVKKQVIAFIEEISKQHPEHLPKVVGQLRGLLSDDVIAVQKRVIQASSIVYRNTLLWICNGGAGIDDMKYVWEQLIELKLQVLNMIDNENEGIRTHSIKFLEEVVLMQTSSDGQGSQDQFSLDQLPAHLPFIKRKALEEESEHIFTLLVKFHNSQHISSVNLMACMTTLCLIAKIRPRYMPRVIQALGDLHTTLPPTLSQSQVNSVRKHLKMLVINLVKQPTSGDMLPQLTQLLLDIGMTVQEVQKVIPKERRNKRVGEIKNGDAPSKRFRVDSPQSISQGSDSNSNSRSDFNMLEDNMESLRADITEDTIYEGLNVEENVVALVMKTLEFGLPDDMPSNFVSIYKPISNAGTKAQKKSLAKLLLTIIKGESVVTPIVTASQPTLSDIAAKIPLLREEDEKLTLKNAVAKLQESTKAERQMEDAVTKLLEETRQEHLKEEEKRTKEKEKPVPPPTPTVPTLKHRVKLLKLQEITRPIPKEIKEKLMVQAVGRILQAEKDAAIGGAAHIRAKLITMFAASYTPAIRELVLTHILEDPLTNIELGIGWLYEEYAYMQGFNRHPVTLQPKVHEKHDQNYNQLLCALITQVSDHGDPNVDSSKDVLLRRIYLEAPLVTEEAVDYLKHLVNEPKTKLLSLELLEEICMMRPPRAHKYITALLSHVLNDSDEIREVALRSIVKIYRASTDAVRKVADKYAKLYLGFIALDTPPRDLADPERGARLVWTEHLYRLCLNLIITLFLENEDLIMDVARVYGQASPEAKRCVLRCVEGPLRQRSSGEPRPAFLALLEECPRGSETLLTRLVHILTEKEAPSEALVSRVRELYATRVSDVRFLIPVLSGLTKKEILAALPKLIKLNPAVVKEVFNKLLGQQNTAEDNLPVTPAELLVALHLIDPGKADLKYIIKATALCFAEKQIFTHEVLATVLQRLVRQPEVPVLTLRSVLQALTLHPVPLAPLVVDLLRQLLHKEVWNNKVAWEGWVKCVERTVPASCDLLLLLPPAPLSACLASAPALRAELRRHVARLPPAAVPPHVLQAAAPEPAPGPAPAPAPVPAPLHYPVETQYLQPGAPNPLEPLPPGME